MDQVGSEMQQSVEEKAELAEGLPAAKVQPVVEADACEGVLVGTQRKAVGCQEAR